MIPDNGSGLHDSSNVNTDGSHIMVVQLVICALGVIANLTVVFVILILREYRKTLTHWYVLQLAIADCSFLLTIPFDYIQEVNGGWIYSNGMCKAKETILFLNYHSSILFLVVMSLDRYIAVCFSRSEIQSKLRTRKVSIIATIVAWGLSLIFCIPIMMYSTKISSNGTCSCGYLFPNDYRSVCINNPELSKQFDTIDECAEAVSAEITNMRDICVNGNGLVPMELSGDYDYEYPGIASGNDMNYTINEMEMENGSDAAVTCNYNHRGPGWFAYLRFLFIGMFIIPLLIMAFCYGCIVRELRRTRIRQIVVSSEARRPNKKRASNNRRLSASSEKANKKVTRVNLTCVLLVVTFIACWLPFHSHHMAMMHGIHASSSRWEINSYPPFSFVPDSSRHFLLLTMEQWLRYAQDFRRQLIQLILIGLQQDFCDTFLKVTSLLIFSNSALNPLIYNFIGTKFTNKVRKAAGTLKSSIRRTSVSSTRGTLAKYNRRRSSSRNSSHGVTINTTGNRSTSSSNGPPNGANWSMVAMPGSTIGPEHIPAVDSTLSESKDGAKDLS